MDQDDRSEKRKKDTVADRPMQTEAEMISDSDILPPEAAEIIDDEDEDEEDTEIKTQDYHVSGEIDKKLQTKPYGEDGIPGTEPHIMDTGDIIVDSGDKVAPSSQEEEEIETKNLQPPVNPPWEDTQQHQVGTVPSSGDPADTFEEPVEKPPFQAAEESTGTSPWGQELDDTGRDEAGLEDTPTHPESASAGVIQVSWDEPVRQKDSQLPDPGPTQIEKDYQPGTDPAQEQTLIFGEGAAAPVHDLPFLVVIQGEEEGREIELTKNEMTIGRGADNDLVFPDIAASRRHALLQRQNDEYIVTDLGSGNGTLLNGKPIQREILKDGDEIEIGSTILQFIRPGHVPQPQPGIRGHTETSPRTVTSGPFTRLIKKLLADPRRRKLIVYGGGGVIGFLFVLILVKAFVGSPTETKASLEEKRRIQEKKSTQQLESHLDAARQLVKEKQWEKAGLRIQLALKIDGENRFALDYRNYVTREQIASKALQAARRSFGDSKWEQAITELNTVSQESEYYEEANRLKKEINQKYINEKLEQGKNLLQQGKPSQAVLKFNEVLKTDPGHKEAALYRRRAEEEEAKEARAALAEKRRARRKPRKRPPTSKPPAKGKTAQLVALYKQGEIDKAIERAEQTGDRKHEVMLKKFKSVYRRGMELANNPGQAARALKFLNQALSQDNAISGGSGAFHDNITDRLGKVHFIRAVDAHTRQKYPEAYKAYCNALKYRPNFEKAKQRLRDLEKTAKKLYEEAYVIKSTNPDQAINKLSIVLKIIPASHVYYGKAKRLRSQIQGPLSREPDSDSGF